MRCASLTTFWQSLVGDALDNIHHRMAGLHFAFDRTRDLMHSFWPQDTSLDDIAAMIQTHWKAQDARPPLTLLPPL